MKIIELFLNLSRRVKSYKYNALSEYLRFHKIKYRFITRLVLVLSKLGFNCYVDGKVAYVEIDLNLVDY